MRVVYIDELFLLNFALDYIICYLTAHFSAHPYRRWRLAVGAAVGAVYAVAARLCELCGFAAPMSLPAKLLAGALIVLCAFGRRGAFLRRTAIFFIFAFLVGGLAYAARIALGEAAALRAVLIAGALALGLSAIFSRSDARETVAEKVEIALKFRGRETKFFALRDSGNLLTDPLDGSPVAVAEVSALEPLFDRETLKILRAGDAVETVARLGASGRWRLIPCRTAGGSAMLAAFRPDFASADGARVRLTVAVSARELGASGAIVGDLSGAKISGKGAADGEALGRAS